MIKTDYLKGMYGWKILVEMQDSLDGQELYFFVSYNDADEGIYSVTKQSIFDYEVKMFKDEMSAEDESVYEEIMSESLCAICSEEGLMHKVPKYNEQYAKIEDEIIKIALENKVKIFGMKK